MLIRLSKRAEADYDFIEDYTVTTHGVKQWLIYSGRIDHAFLTLRRFPNIGMPSRELPRGYLAYKVQHHWICYEVVGDIIEVRAIIHQLGHYENPPKQ